MPRSASTSKRNASSGRGRFQPQPIESELERTPVLFRLPEVELPPPAPKSSSTEDLQPTEEYQDEYQTPPEDFESEFVALPRRSQLDLPSADDADPARQKSREFQAGATITTSASASAEEEKPGSWWEHWSSGVVLILLIIALVTASIIAFNDAQPPEPDLLAKDGKSEEFSLSEILIPEMQADLPGIPKTADTAAISTSMIPPLSLPTQSGNKPAQQAPPENTNSLRESLAGLSPNSPAAPAASPVSQLANQPPASTPDSSGPSMSLSENLQFSEPTLALIAASADTVAKKESNSSAPGFNANSVDNSNQPGGGLSLKLPPLGQQDSLLLPPLAEMENNNTQNVELTNLEPAIPEPQLPADTTVVSALPSATPKKFPAIPETPAATYDSILRLPIPSDPAAGNVQTVAGGPADAQFSTSGHRTAATVTQPQLGDTPLLNSPATSSSFTPDSSPPGLTPEGTAQVPTGNQTTRTATPQQQNNTPELRRTATAEGNEDAIIRAWQSFRPSSNRYQ